MCKIGKITESQPLRRYYTKVGKKLTDAAVQLRQYLATANCEESDLGARIDSAHG